MIRVLGFLAVVFAVSIGFMWLADRPGDIDITFNGYHVQFSIMVAAWMIAALLAVTMLTWWLLRSLWDSPRAMGRYFRARRRDRGYQALSTGLIAAGAGDVGLARRMSKQAGTQLSADQEPLLHLLDAQTLLLEGKHEAARAKFEAMAADPETRSLGLRGLYLEARRLGEHEAARHYAEVAAGEGPQLAWAANATIGLRLAEDDHDGALKLLAGQAAARQIGKEEAAARRAVLLTAKARSLLDTDPASARAAALEAHKLAPDLVPAAVASGRVLSRLEEFRKAIRILEDAWKKSPHPEIAAAYVHLRAGDSTHDRLKRARRLESLAPNHVESALAVARASLEAGEFGEARNAAEAALRMAPRESAYLLLADIEEAETGDQGRIRHWLAKAVRAPRDPAWTADGYVSEQWAAVSPVTGAIGAFQWRVPVEQLGPVVEAEEDRAAPPPVAAPEALAPPVAAEPEPVPAPRPAPPPPPPPVAPVSDAAPASKDVPAPPLPDDPGVEEGDRTEETNRFRLF